MRDLKSRKEKAGETERESNSGFTLVELIVVLVIMAIMAALLVPSLLGYIDRAKKQQLILNAESAYTAAQAEFSDMYAKDRKFGELSSAEADKIMDRIMDTADLPSDAQLTVGCSVDMDNVATGENIHDAYKITYVKYSEGTSGNTIYYDGNAWVEDGAAAPAKTWVIR